jgi:hypothetical protein
MQRKKKKLQKACSALFLHKSMMKVWNMDVKKVFLLVKNKNTPKKGIFDVIENLFYMFIFDNFFFLATLHSLLHTQQSHFDTVRNDFY